MEKDCKYCNNSFIAFNTIQNKCHACTLKYTKKKHPKPRKPIAQRGKRTIQYEKWRDLIARPHLVRVYGNLCQECGRRAFKYLDDYTGAEREENLDVAHIVGRGRDASMKMVITNVRLLCRNCHRRETDGKL